MPTAHNSDGSTHIADMPPEEPSEETVVDDEQPTPSGDDPPIPLAHEPPAASEESQPSKKKAKLIKPTLPTSKNRKKKHVKWNESPYKEAMDVALLSMLVQGNTMKAIAEANKQFPSIPIPRQTLDSKFAKLKKEMAEQDEGESDLAKFDRLKVAKGGQCVKGSLTSADDRTFLQSVVNAREKRNVGISRKEIISILAEMKSVSFKTAENHYDHLIRSKQMARLHNDDRVVRDQPTTTDPTVITTEKLLRTYTTQEQAWAIQAELNGWDEGQMTPAQLNDHKKVKDAHTCNLVESYIMASEGIITVVGSKDKTKHENNMFEESDSITSIRVGSASNVDGPRVFLAKGEEIELAFEKFTDNFPSPVGSCVEMTPNAEMTDEAWCNIGPNLCKGIRAMDGVQENCWVVCSLDGFGGHLDAEQLLVFSEYKILVIQEEGDSSQESEGYDQIVANEDNRRAQELLEAINQTEENPMNQWDLIITLNEALNLVAKSQASRTSFIRVNFCPSQRVPFRVWFTIYQDTFETADLFFKTRLGLFDAMPACWRYLTERERRQLCTIIDGFPNKWIIEHMKTILQLGYVKLEDVDKIRACYFVTKEDESVFEDVADSKPANRQWMLDQDYYGFAFAPKDLLEEYVQDKKDHPMPPSNYAKGQEENLKQMCWPEGRRRDIAAELFVHMTNYVASNHGWHTGSDLVPSKYLDVEMSREQVDFLNPTPRDETLSSIIDQCTGTSAKKNIAKRRIDMISGNINSYARVLNGPAQHKNIKTYDQLSTSLAVVKRERDQKNEAEREKDMMEDAEMAAEKVDLI